MRFSYCAFLPALVLGCLWSSEAIFFGRNSVEQESLRERIDSYLAKECNTMTIQEQLDALVRWYNNLKDRKGKDRHLAKELSNLINLRWISSDENICTKRAGYILQNSWRSPPSKGEQASPSWLIYERYADQHAEYCLRQYPQKLKAFIDSVRGEQKQTVDLLARTVIENRLKNPSRETGDEQEHSSERKFEVASKMSMLEDKDIESIYEFLVKLAAADHQVFLIKALAPTKATIREDVSLVNSVVFGPVYGDCLKYNGKLADVYVPFEQDRRYVSLSHQQNTLQGESLEEFYEEYVKFKVCSLIVEDRLLSKRIESLMLYKAALEEARDDSD